MEKKKELETESSELTQEQEATENNEETILTQMAEQEEGEFNQQEETEDDITHDVRISKTRTR